MEMITIKDLKTLYVRTSKVNLKYNLKQYYEMSKVFITREEDDIGKGYFFSYGYYENDHKLIWEFSVKDVFAICPISIELKKEEDFITPEHYKKYIDKYKGKELLDVYVGGWPYDTRYTVDANTGEIYDKMESR